MALICIPLISNKEGGTFCDRFVFSTLFIVTFFLKIFVFVYLAVPGLGCGSQHLYLRHADS